LIDQDDKLSTLNVSAGSYKLHLRDLPDALLGVLMSMHANMPALNMAINVAVRRLPALRHESVPAPPPPPSVPTVPHHAVPSPHPLPPAGAVPYPTERKTVPPPFHGEARTSPGSNEVTTAERPAGRPDVRHPDESTMQTPTHATVFQEATPRPRTVMFRGRKLRED
jgi:hypothetical protein